MKRHGFTRLLLITLLLTMTAPPSLFGASVVLRWQPNTEPDLTGYNIYYGTQPRSYRPPIPVEGTATYTLEGLEENTLYYFAVTAVDNNGNESGFSEEISKSISAPDATAPVIAITTPTDTDRYTTSNPRVGLAGSASDDRSLQQISWTSSSGASGVATGTDSWSIEAIDLVAGDNQITVTATDSAGNNAQDTITVTYAAAGELTVVGVSASTHDGNRAENTLDNNLSSRWSARGDGQWIQYDLGDHYSIAEVAIAFFRGDVRRADFEILVSSDANTWNRVFSGQSSGTTLQLENYALAGAQGRFVRIVGHGNTSSAWNSITEVDIFGAASTPSDVTASTVETSSPAANSSYGSSRVQVRLAAVGPWRFQNTL